MKLTYSSPPKASAFQVFLGKLVYKFSGWRILGEFPKSPKSVIIFAPHTTNWDFVHIVFGIFYLGVKPNYLAKEELFFWPAKYFFFWTGGIPVDRRKNKNIVEATARAIQESEKIVIGIAPEATRGKSKYWRSGFYHIANIAHVPIHFAYVDYEQKIAGVAEGIIPSGDIDADMEKIRAFYKDKIRKGKYPENISEIAFKPK